jgi:hypothetical protein
MAPLISLELCHSVLLYAFGPDQARLAPHPKNPTKFSKNRFNTIRIYQPYFIFINKRQAE